MRDFVKLRGYMFIGIIFVFIVGSLLHFVYDWSGQNAFLGLFTPINESVWEHFKLGFYGFLIYAVMIYPRLRGQVNNYWFGVGIATLLLNAVIFFLYYLYTHFTGKSIFYIDIALFALAVGIAFKIFYHILMMEELPRDFEYLGLCIILMSIIIFAVFTIHPPNISLFKDPTLISNALY